MPTSTAQDRIFRDVLRTLRRLHRRASGVRTVLRALRLGWS